MPRPDWDEYFLDIAKVVATRADCTRRQVGAVIVDEENRIVSTGYNGAPAGDPGCLGGACPRGQLSYEEVKEFTDYDSGPGRCISLHAEANALLYARRDLRGCTIYITDQPCPTCDKLIRGAGIETVIWGPSERLPVCLHYSTYYGLACTKRTDHDRGYIKGHKSLHANGEVRWGPDGS